MVSPELEVIRSEHEWTWYRLQDSRQLIEHEDFDERMQEWAAESVMCRHNHISTISYVEGNNAMNGTLIARLADSAADGWIFHYYVNGDKLITTGDTDWLEQVIGVTEWEEYVRKQQTPIEGFIFIINSFIRALFTRMDAIEQNLMKIEERMQGNNGSRLLKEIIDLRNQLTRWNMHTVALREIEYAIEETFPDTIEHSNTCRIMEIYLKRIRMLQQNYEHEIDSLLKVDDNIGNYRSNMIMKTLTVFTVLLTPMTALGAIWGMNFKNMPELDWSWGYAGALGLIGLTTLITYLWLKSTGLTDDILKINIKDEEESDN
ncbi:CorA family divalent cation transporter [Paenibacillus hunanensis]|uniref:CorA family divalent cation transporter n=1 Tax=Paenibacillus hunanensis TaxID=539262 RepID=UPI002A6B3F4D|nr:CorA family divalent cation transporter [Paenibacillus hunanensis]WPP41621.1 CorA family divalent cation transporter [Paenibacillus hunanensis]